MKELKVLKQIQETSSKNEKIEILKKNDTPQLRTLLNLTYDRFKTYRVKQLDFPEEYNIVQPDITDELEQLLLLLAKHKTGSNDAKNMLKRLMTRCTEEGAQWVAKIVTKDLKIGIDESSINKAFKGLIPVFGIQLALPIFKGGQNPKNYWPTLKYPLVAETKLNGCRLICICRDGVATFYSREGHEFGNCEVFGEEVLKLRPGTNYVVDGEVLATRFNPDNEQALKNKDHDWHYSSGKSMLKNAKTTRQEVNDYLGYYIWDFIELDVFESQGKSDFLEKRKLTLAALFERRLHEFKNIIRMPTAVVHNEAEVKELFRRVRTKDPKNYSAVNKKGETITYQTPIGEGLCLKALDKPYEFSRTQAVFKVKEFYTADLRIVGAEEGEKGSKFEGMLGALVLESDCGEAKGKCGSGLDAAQRYELWQEFKKGDLVGKIVEVSYLELTVDGVLYGPVFQGFRDDKTCTSVG